VDERCIGVGVRVMAATALTAIGGQHGPSSVIGQVGAAGRSGTDAYAGHGGGYGAPAGGTPADGVTLAGPLLAGYGPDAGP
jgi:hypothetical protein